MNSSPDIRGEVAAPTYIISSSTVFKQNVFLPIEIDLQAVLNGNLVT